MQKTLQKTERNQKKLLDGDVTGITVIALVLGVFLFLTWGLFSFLPLWSKIGITASFLIWALKKIGLLYLWAV